MFNSKYKKGMADAAKAYADFGKKQEEAIKWTREELQKQGIEISGKLDDIKGNIDHLYDYIESRDKEKLYTVYTPFDIQDMGEEEQRFLVGVLFTMSTNRKPNEYQQNYFRSIMRYLGINEPPAGTNPLAIEYIDDLKAQKAILQAVMEFLRLQDGDYYDETEQQQEFLDAFNVNSKGRQEIAYHVELLFQATGAKGLAEKYGYVADTEENESAGDKEKPKGMSEELAKIIYSFPSSGRDGEEVVDDTLETKDFILIKWRIEGSYDSSMSGLKSIRKVDGKETAFPNVVLGLVNERWYNYKSVNNVALIYTEKRRLYSLDLQTGISKKIFQADDSFKIIDATEDEIFLCLDYDGGLLINWNGDIIKEGDKLHDFRENCFFYNGDLWRVSLEWDAGKQEEELFLHKFSSQNKSITCEYSYSFDDNSSYYLTKIALYKQKLFILIETDSGYGGEKNTNSLFCLQLSNLRLTQITDNIKTYSYMSYGGRRFKKAQKGWVFVADDNPYSYEYTLKLFDFETEEIKALAKGCGYDMQYTSGFFKKTVKTDHYANDFTLMDKYVFFIIGENRPFCSKNKAMVSLDKPMEVHMIN